MDALLDDTSLKLGEGAADAEDQLPHKRRGVDVLLVDEQIAPDGFQVLDSPQQVDQ